MQERFDDYCARVRLPLNIVTSAANLTIASVEDLMDGFDDFVAMIHSRGVTSMIRPVMGAAFDGPDRIVGVYETRLMDGQRMAMPQFYSKMWIGQFDGVWQATKIHNTTYDPRWPLMLTRVKPGQRPPKEFQT